MRTDILFVAATLAAEVSGSGGENMTNSIGMKLLRIDPGSLSGWMRYNRQQTVGHSQKLESGPDWNRR